MGQETLVVDGQLVLRPVTEAMEPAIVEAVRESYAHLSPWTVWAKEDYGPQDAQVFIELVAADDRLDYAMSGRDDSGLHGVCSLNRIDETNRTANLGYWVRVTSTGRGLATRSARRVLVHAFEDLGMERIEIVISAANSASLRVAQRLGVQEEGVRHRALRIGGEQHDARVFAAFPSDLERLREHGRS